MSMQAARAHLAKFGLEGRIREFSVSSATVELAAGTAASAVELNLAELEQASSASGWVDVCKGWRPEQS